MISRRLRFELAGRAVGPLLFTVDAWRAALRRRTRPASSPFGPPLESTRRLKRLMGVSYFQGRWADGAVPVAWVSSGFPTELLRAYGFYCVYPENHAALCSARHMAPQLSEAAERTGYSRNLCSYARIDLGSVLSGDTPVGRVPAPDLVAVCSNICQTIISWFRIVAEHFGVPFVLIDTPFVHGEPAPHHLQFVADQLHEVDEVAARVAGREADEERQQRVVDEAWKASKLWGECLELNRNRPAPWTTFDQFVNMAPIVALRGSPSCTAFYTRLRDELAERAHRGIGGIAEERHRLLWDNIAVWHQLRPMAREFASRGFAFVCATYTWMWWQSWAHFDPADRIGSTSRMLSTILLNRDLPNRLELMSGLARDFEVDGAVLHSDRSCKPYSVGQYDLKAALQKNPGIKVTVLEADHADPRAWSEEQAATRLQAFFESFYD